LGAAVARRLGGGLAALALLVSAAPARAVEPEFAPKPAWATELAPDFDKVGEEERGSDSFTLLHDSRVHLLGERFERYERRVRKALTPAGVERLAEVLVEFSPEYEKLVLHGMQLRRGAQLIDQTRSARVRMVAQESQLDRSMYNGDVSAYVVLSDVRVGDSIDFSYSIVEARRDDALQRPRSRRKAQRAFRQLRQRAEQTVQQLLPE